MLFDEDRPGPRSLRTFAVPLFSRPSLFWKYAAYFSGLVSALLVVSGAVGGYFAYREAVAALEELQLARAHFAASQHRGLHARRAGGAARDRQQVQHRRASRSRGPAHRAGCRSCVIIPRSARCVGSPPRARSASSYRDSVPMSRAAATTGPMIRLSSEHTKPPGTSAGVLPQGDGAVCLGRGRARCRKQRSCRRSEPQARVGRDFAGTAGARRRCLRGRRSGQLISHPDMGWFSPRRTCPGCRMCGGLWIVRCLAQRSSATARDVKGMRVVATAERIEGLGWTVFAEQSLDEAFLPAYASIARSIVLVLLGVDGGRRSQPPAGAEHGAADSRNRNAGATTGRGGSRMAASRFPPATSSRRLPVNSTAWPTRLQETHEMQDRALPRGRATSRSPTRPRAAFSRWRVTICGNRSTHSGCSWAAPRGQAAAGRSGACRKD